MNPIMASALITAFTMAFASTGCAEQKEDEKKPPQQESPAPSAPNIEEKGQDRTNPHERARRNRADEEGRRKPSRPTGDAVPFIGVVTREVSPELASQIGLEERAGVLVEEVMPDSPAAKAGIKKFDVITRLNGERINDPAHLSDLVRSKEKGAEVAIEVIRRGAKQDLKVAVDERPVPPGFGASPWGRGPSDRGPFGPWGYRMERWWQDEPWRERERDRDRERGQPKAPDTMDEMFQQLERFTREFQDQQHRLEQQLREYQERFQRQMREFQERMRERKRDLDRKEAPPPGKPEGSAMGPGLEPGREATRSEQRRVHVSVQVPGAGMAHVTSGGVVQREDPSGLYRVEHHPEGEVTFTARTPDGKERSWPVTTEQQRGAVPEPFRQKLRELDGVHIQIGPEKGTPGQSPATEGPKTEA